jgi:hypothetical protein
LLSQQRSDAFRQSVGAVRDTDQCVRQIVGVQFPNGAGINGYPLDIETAARLYFIEIQLSAMVAVHECMMLNTFGVDYADRIFENMVTEFINILLQSLFESGHITPRLTELIQ